MGLLVFYFALAIIVSFVCSLLESTILSVPYSYVQSTVRKNVFYADLLQRLKYQISRPLSAILTVNTVANTLGAAGVGAQVHEIYGNSYVTLFSVGLTFTILIFSEIIPKTLGANYWRITLPVAVYIIQGLIYVCYPFVLMSHYLNKILGGKAHSFTRDDLIGVFETGVNDGAIFKNEGALLKNILRLQNKKVLEIMTPRTVVTAFEKNITVDEVINKYKPLRFERIPVYEGHFDQIIGMVNRYKIIDAYSKDEEHTKIDVFLKPVHIIPENISVTAALDQFLKRKEHMFVVVDEYGSVSGLVTMEDVVETILGAEIVDELDSVEDLRKQALKQWKQKKSQIRKLP